MNGRVTKRDPQIVQTHGRRGRNRVRTAEIGKGNTAMNNERNNIFGAVMNSERTLYGMFGVTITLAVITIVLVFLGGCNTMAGIGADIQAAAKGTQDYLAGDRKVGDNNSGDVTWDR